MQEEIENRTVNLAISTTKLTARGIIRLALQRDLPISNENPMKRR